MSSKLATWQHCKFSGLSAFQGAACKRQMCHGNGNGIPRCCDSLRRSWPIFLGWPYLVAFLGRNLCGRLFWFEISFLNNRLIFGQSRQQSQWKWRTQVSAVPVVPFVPCAFSHGIFAGSQDFAQVMTLRSSWRLRTWPLPNCCCDRSVTILQAISMLCLPISTALGGGTGLVGRVFSNRSCTDTWRDCRMTLPIYNSSTWICSDLRKILDFSNGILAQLVNGWLFP